MLSPTTMAVRNVVCPVHVGRDAEILALQHSAEAVGVAGRVVLIGGEAGVGKSRMAGEATRIAEARAFVALSAACTENAAAPYAPLAAALRRHVRTLDATALGALFDGPALQAAAILPEIGASLGVESSAGTGAPEHLNAAFWHIVRRLGSERPLLLLIEDIHWASVDTLRLIGHLAEESPTLPLWLVVTYRTDELHRRHPLTPLLTSLRRAAHVDELLLTPLQRTDQRRMLSALFGDTPVGDEFTDAVRERTGGNPFFLEELAAVMVERGDIFQSGGTWDRRSLDDIEMPMTVREALLSRVARLDPQTIRILQLAAVAGERIEPRIVACAEGVVPSTVDAALVAALERQLLVERRDGASRHYAFRHALTREALEDDLVGPERVDAHRRIADALATVHADNIDSVAAQLSDHFEAAGDAIQAAAYALRAARRAAAEHAPAAAGDFYARALQPLPPSSPERLELLVEAAQATYRDVDRRLSSSFAREARALAQERGDPVAEARALRWLSQDRWDSGDADGALALAREAAELCADRDDWTEAWALASLARRLTTRGAHDEARPVLARAIDVGGRAHHNSALARAHATRMLLAHTDDERDAALEEAVRFASAAGDQVSELWAVNSAGFAALWTGRLDRAVRLIARSVDLGERISPNDATYFRAALGWARSLVGDYDGALEAAVPLRETAVITARMVALTALAEVHLRRGDVDVAREEAEENLRLAKANGETQRIDPALAHVARVRLLDGPTAAEDIIVAFLRAPLRPHVHALISPDLAQALQRQGDDHRLAALVDKVRAITAVDSNRHNDAATAMCESALDQLRGDVVAARDRSQVAATLYSDMPCPAREAEALIALAELCSSAGDATACQAAASKAAAIAARLQSPSLVREAQSWLERGATDVVLATVLVTDIVDSTKRAVALGDRAWRDLLERHHAIVRRELRRQHGREVDTAGDGFLAAFDSPARGIRCAVDAVAALAAAGIDVRAGLHTGECEVIGDKLAGVVVHTAARVASVADGGEVLVSSTVRDLVAGAGFVFEDRGVHALKGVPGEWRLCAVGSHHDAARA